jgi:hypothetical protein
MFIIRDKVTKEIIRRSASPLRSDNKLPADLDSNVEVLEEVRESQPEYDQATHKLALAQREEVRAKDEPIKLIYSWEILPLTSEDLIAQRRMVYPSAESYQVRAWMIRGGLDPDLVPTIIAQVVPDGPQRKEALMRWDYAVRIPRDFPLVDVIGAQMNLTPEQIDAAWPEILTL